MTISVSVGLLILRVAVGLTIAGHGSQKLFGWFGGAGFTKMQAGLQAQGFKPAALWVAFAILGELGGGLSLTFGLLTSVGAAGVFGAMLVATRSHWKNGFWNTKRGIEYPLLLLLAAVALGFTGAGAYSLDALLGIAFHHTLVFLILAAAALIVGVIGILMSHPAPAAPAPTPVLATEQKPQ
jgi:putative oxidoreductase